MSVKFCKHLQTKMKKQGISYFEQFSQPQGRFFSLWKSSGEMDGSLPKLLSAPLVRQGFLVIQGDFLNKRLASTHSTE